MPGLAKSKSPKWKSFLIKSGSYLILAFFICFFLFPFYYMAVIGTWNVLPISVVPPYMWFGDKLLSNLNILLHEVIFVQSLFNSIAISVLSALTQIFFCTMTGFAFAKYHFKFKNLLFMIVIGALMLPRFLNILPLFQMMVWFRWINTYLALVIPAMANPFGVFLMKQYIESSLPDELLEAGRLDGLSTYQILFRIVFPMEKAAIAVLGTIIFVSSWNDFLMSFIMLPNRDAFTIPIMLQSLFNDINSMAGQCELMTAACLTMLPVILIFFFASKQIMSSLLSGSIKG
jgi:multiple sugar transport system permease protein